MKVRELQQQLSQLDPELDIVFYCEDENLLGEGRGFILFELTGAQKVDAELMRLEDQTPYMKFGRSDVSTPLAIVEVTSDF